MQQTKQQAKNADKLEKWLEENKPHIKIKDKAKYRNNTTAITFICAEHGEYIAQPRTVKAAKYGCRLCSGKSQQLSFEDFVKSATSIHGDKYEYDENTWSGSSNKTKIFCKQCNIFFEPRGTDHMDGNGCPVCNHKSQQMPFEEFVKKAILIHGNKYKYDESSWGGSNNKTKILCLQCGDYFAPTGSNHLRGSGCPVCNTGGFDNENNFARNPDLANELCKLYYIKINGLYKIGITKKTLAQRYPNQQFEILFVRETTRLFAWRVEQIILSEFSEYKQRGDIGRGSTECFATDISTLENFHEIFNHDFTEPIQ